MKQEKERTKAMRKNKRKNIQTILQQLNQNKKSALLLLHVLNSTVTDDTSYALAIHQINDYYEAGIISGCLRDFMIKEIYYVHSHNSPSKPASGMIDYTSFKGIAEYINSNNYWVTREVIINNALLIEHNHDIDGACFCIDSHYAMGDISHSIATTTKEWLFDVYHNRAEDFHEIEREYGYDI